MYGLTLSGLEFVTSRWLLCCFHGILPAEAVARVFDQMLLARHNAPAVLLRIGLGVLVRASDRLLACDCDALLMEELLHSPDGIRTAADISMLFHAAWQRVGVLPGARAMRHRLADEQQDEELKRWAAGLEPSLEEEQPALPTSSADGADSAAATLPFRIGNAAEASVARANKRRRGGARVWDGTASAAMAKAASWSSLTVKAGDGEDAPAPPLARALSEGNVNRPKDRMLPIASPALAGSKRTSYTTASARKIRGLDLASGNASGGNDLFGNDLRGNKRRRKNGEEDEPEGIELTDLRGISAGKKLRLLCETAE